MTDCWHTACSSEARHTLSTGEELCDLHLAVLRSLHEQRRNILDPGLAGSPDTDLPAVQSALDELTDSLIRPEA